MFFAFAGYARVPRSVARSATPQRTIPRAVALALGITLVVYLLVASALLVGLGPERLAPADVARSPRSWTRGGRRASV